MATAKIIIDVEDAKAGYSLGYEIAFSETTHRKAMVMAAADLVEFLRMNLDEADLRQIVERLGAAKEPKRKARKMDDVT